MTLPELLVATAIFGLVVSVLSGAVMVIIRHQSNAMERFNVARAEQNIGTWLPSDLASAATIVAEINQNGAYAVNSWEVQ